VLTAGSRSGKLLILKDGVAAIIKEDIEIAKVREPGAVLGELSALLDQPHTANVRALETSQFHVADASTLLGKDPVALLYVAAIMARRLDSANHALLELKSQLQGGEPRSEIDKTVEKINLIICAGGASLVYAGYPYDPYE
jgi:CRP/FNR family cyclic AMP-dependent transcriptional regulator